MDEGGLLRRATPEHVLSPIDPRVREPCRVLGRPCGDIDYMRALVADDVCVVPDRAPEFVYVICGPLVEIRVGLEGETVLGVYALHELKCARRLGRSWRVEGHGGCVMDFAG